MLIFATDLTTDQEITSLLLCVSLYGELLKSYLCKATVNLGQWCKNVKNLLKNLSLTYCKLKAKEHDIAFQEKCYLFQTCIWYFQLTISDVHALLLAYYFRHYPLL